MFEGFLNMPLVLSLELAQIIFDDRFRVIPVSFFVANFVKILLNLRI